MTPDTTLANLMEDYDRRFPDAGEFARSGVQYEYRRTLEDLDRLGYQVVIDL